MLDDEDLERIERLASNDDDVEGLLETLPPEQREAVRARILEDRTYDEIAGALQCSPGRAPPPGAVDGQATHEGGRA